jgi:hypothetical protein
VLGLAAVLAPRVWSAWSLRWRNLDDATVLEVARHVRDGEGLVTLVNTSREAAAWPLPIADAPLWPWLLGHGARFVDLFDLAQWAPLGLYGVAVLGAFAAGRATLPAPLLPSGRPPIHGGHLAAALVAFDPGCLAATAWPSGAGLAWALGGAYVASVSGGGGRGRGVAAGALGALLFLAAPALVPLVVLGLFVLVVQALRGSSARGAAVGGLAAVLAAGAVLGAWREGVGPLPVPVLPRRAEALPAALLSGGIVALAAPFLGGVLRRGGLLGLLVAVGVSARVASGVSFIGRAALDARADSAAADAHAGLVGWLKQHSGRADFAEVLLDGPTARRIAWRTRKVGYTVIGERDSYAEVAKLAEARGAQWIVHPGEASEWAFREQSAGRLERDYERLVDAPDGYTILARRARPVEQTSTPRKVLLIGVDGATWKVMGPMVEAGELPTFARLYREGASMVAFDTMESQDSPVVWTSVVTGRRPKDHGVKDYTEEVAGAGKVPITSNSRRVPAIWNVATWAGRSVEVVNWWASWPAEAVNGVIVSDHANPAAAGWMAGKYFSADPEKLKALMQDTWPGTLGAELEPYWIAPDAFPVDAFMAQARLSAAQLEQLLAAPYNERTAYSWLKTFYTLDAPHAQLAVDHLRAAPADLTLVYLRGPDPVQHYAWNLVEPWAYATPPKTLDRDRGLVEAVYRYTDAHVGALLEAAGPDTTVIVMSDHGSEPCSYAVGPNSKKRPGCHRSEAKGILFVAGPGVQAGGRIEHASPMDIAPTVAWLSGLPVSREMPGRVLSEALRPDAAAAIPLHLVDSWGPRAETAAPSTASPADGQMLEQLRGLGYIE